MITERQLLALDDVIAVLNSEGITKNMRVHRKVVALHTVDAVEVVHGEWIVCGDGEYVPFMCSACGKTTSWYHAQTANYCPNCGAKMNLEESNNDD